MENPYQTPTAESTIPTTNHKKSIWWKIYFFLISFLSIVGMITFLQDEKAGIVDYAEFILLLIATMGLFGYVFSKKVLFPRFWIPFLLFYVVTGFAYESLSAVDMRQGLSDNMGLISSVVGILMALPGYYALFRYGNKNSYPWTVQANDNTDNIDTSKT